MFYAGIDGCVFKASDSGGIFAAEAVKYNGDRTCNLVDTGSPIGNGCQIWRFQYCEFWNSGISFGLHWKIKQLTEIN